MAFLEIKDLSIQFGGIQALDSFSLDLEPGTFVGLMGPNGAGKTTVINCISRIYNPTGGSITFEGRDLLKSRGDEVVGLGIARTFQDLNFFSRISDMMIIDYLRLGQFNPKNISFWRDGFHLKKSRDFERDLKTRARRVLELFRDTREKLEVPEEERGYPFLLGREGFPDLIDVEFEKIGSLSFAWRKRLDLARALVSDPKLLLLDEPAQGMPPSEIENMGKMLNLLQKELKISALIVDHNVHTLSRISNKIVVMNAGQKIAEGLPETVVRDRKVIEIYLGASEGTTAEAAGTERPQSNIDTSTEAPLLEAKSLDVFYGFAQALFSVSIKVYAQKVAVILGTNGSGKSTLLRALSGIEKPRYGEILFRGETVPLGWPEVAVTRGIQYVPQGHVIFPELSVMENLKIGAYAFRRTHEFDEGRGLEKVLHYFPQLKELMKVQAASLSGGQQQMLAIGQAIIGRPQLLLLDEPSLGLSPNMVDFLFAVILRISREEKCSVLIVEQNVAKALSVADYVYMLSSGVLVGEGNKRQFSEESINKNLGFS